MFEQDGEAAGKQLLLGDIIGNYVLIGTCYGMDDLAGVLGAMKPGDTVTLDNSDYIAIQSYYRHQVPPDPAFHAWDQFRDENGKPAIPQRSYIMGPHFCGTGTVRKQREKAIVHFLRQQFLNAVWECNFGSKSFLQNMAMNKLS